MLKNTPRTKCGVVFDKTKNQDWNMDQKIRQDALEIVGKAIEILKTKEDKDILELKELSDHTIHNASVFQDNCSVSLAVLAYALSKMMMRYPQESYEYKEILKLFLIEKENLEKDDENGFNDTMKRLFLLISKIDSKLEMYVQEVINNAQIKKGSKLCEHGVSCAKSAEVLGVSQWDLMNYLGKTKLVEYASGIDLKSRLRFARRLFS